MIVIYFGDACEQGQSERGRLCVCVCRRSRRNRSQSFRSRWANETQHEAPVTFEAPDIIGHMTAAFQYKLPHKVSEQCTSRRWHKLRSVGAICPSLLFTLGDPTGRRGNRSRWENKIWHNIRGSGGILHYLLLLFSLIQVERGNFLVLFCFEKNC